MQSEKSEPVESPTRRPPGQKESPLWADVIDPHFNPVVKENGPFASLNKACESVQLLLEARKKTMSESAIKRGIKRSRLHWVRGAQ